MRFEDLRAVNATTMIVWNVMRHGLFYQTAQRHTPRNHTITTKQATYLETLILKRVRVTVDAVKKQ